MWGGQMEDSYYQQMWHRIKDEKKSFNGVVRNKRKNGDIYSAQIVISPILGENQTLLGYASLENDISDQMIAREATDISELRYRRLFETAQDGILLLNFQTGMIEDVNKFLIDMLGYTKEEFLTKHLWEVGLFKDEVEQKDNFAILKEKGYVRFENLPLETKDKKPINVEFVANAYQVDGSTVIQCNIRDITDRVRADALAKISELRYRRLFETAQDGILLLNFETGMITDANQFLIDILGYSKEELLVKHVWEVGFFQNEAAQKENLAILQEKGYVRFENLPLETKDKKPINVEFVANAYKVGEETVIQCNIRNITDRVRSDAKMKWLASFPTLNPRPILEIDKVLGIIYVNPMAQRLFPDLSSLKMSHPFLNEILKYFESLSTTEKSSDSRELQTKDRWYLQEINIIGPGRIRVYGSDITNLKEKEYAFAKGKAFDEAILSTIDEGVIVCDKVGKINLFNKKAGELVGISPNEAIGQDYGEVILLERERDGSKYEDFFAKAIAGNEPLKMEKQVLLVNKAGAKIPVAGSGSPIIINDGSVIGGVISIYDVTMERSVDKAKTEFVSLASHQMRTPLTAINWYAELLLSEKHGQLNSEQSQFASEVHTASKRMSALVNSLLNVSRLEMGSFVIEPVLLSVVDVAEENISLLASQILAKKLVLRKEFESNLGVFSADPKLLGIIIQNLLSNAVKYTPSGGTIGLEIKKEGEKLKITLSDTGAGIPKEDQDKIFGKLYRAENAKVLDPGGTGLGLYIVHEVVTGSGGRIWFESEEGKGTTFYITFPLAGMVKKVGDKRIT